MQSAIFATVPQTIVKSIVNGASKNPGAVTLKSFTMALNYT